MLINNDRVSIDILSMEFYMIDIKFENNRSAAYDCNNLIGECDFEISNNIWTVNHTRVDQNYGGQGIAKKLVNCVVDNAVKQGVKIKPVCSYVVHEFEKNPQEYSLVKID